MRFALAIENDPSPNADPSDLTVYLADPTLKLQFFPIFDRFVDQLPDFFLVIGQYVIEQNVE